jgi:hypothetical protein
MRDELYFRLNLTEGEHWVVEEEFRIFCKENDIELVYYRPIRTGHIPMIREIKTRGNVGIVRGYLKREKLDKHIAHNQDRAFGDTRELIESKAF